MMVQDMASGGDRRSRFSALFRNVESNRRVLCLSCFKLVWPLAESSSVQKAIISSHCRTLI